MTPPSLNLLGFAFGLPSTAHTVGKNNVAPSLKGKDNVALGSALTGSGHGAVARRSILNFWVTARRLAEFLESVEAEEILLTQRLRDRESRTIRSGNIAVMENSNLIVATAMRPDTPPAMAD